jgi:hypothetical protein
MKNTEENERERMENKVETTERKKNVRTIKVKVT